MFLTNENITFAATKDGKVAAVTKTCNVVAYKGATKVTPTVGTPTGAPSGMTVTVGSATDNEIPLSIAITANATLGGSGQQNGVVNVPITAPVATTLQIQWSKVNTGATGSAGAGASNLSVYSPTGTVFTNGLAEDNDEVTLTALYFQGATDLTTNTKSAYLWEKYESGSWTTVKAEATGSSGNTYTVHAADVQGSATYRCRASYNNGTTYFYDTITIIDKTDNYQADVDSTAGDVFKNIMLCAAALVLAGCGQKETSVTTVNALTTVVPTVQTKSSTAVPIFSEATDAPASEFSAMEIDLTSMSSTMVYSYVFNMISTPDDFIGQRFRIRGIYDEQYWDQTNLTYHYIVIADATACCAQGLEFVLTDPNVAYPQVGEEFEISGVFGTYEENETLYIQITANQITRL